MSGKKKLVQINTVCNNSTGHIMHDIQVAAKQNGYETLSIVGRRKVYTDVPCVKYGNPVSFWIHVAITTVFDKQGWGSYFSTQRIVKRLRKEQPDIIHLHNLHGYYLNFPVLFRYLCNDFKGQVVWTFHDCWPFTGHCPYYTIAGCNRWKLECHNCPNKMLYPTSLLFDASRSNYHWKKKVFNLLNNITVIVPSNWLHIQVKQSYFSNADICVVENGIDFDIFYPQDDDFIKRKYKSNGKKILLGVASIWEKRKGLEKFLELSKELSEEYIIILVGLTSKQCKKLPHNVVGIQRTEDVNELAKLYSAADVFINPSCEETFSMVTVEAMACGTPVIVRDGSATEELVTEECGIVIRRNNVNTYLEAIRDLTTRNLKPEKIVEHARIYSKKRMTDSILTKYRY